MTEIRPDEHDWVFDLIAEDDASRKAALGRHRALLEEFSAAQQRTNRFLTEAAMPVPGRLHVATEFDRAFAAQQAVKIKTLFGPLAAFFEAESAPVRAVYAPYALLFLQWERRYPDEWREAGTWTSSPWTPKELSLARLARDGVPAAHSDEVARLVIAAVEGPYRCKDWRYAPLARRVDGQDLRGRLGALAEHTNPLTRLRVQFLVHLLDNPSQRITRKTWRRWLQRVKGRESAASDNPA